MPTAPARACLRPGCANLQPCPDHARGETYRETVTARPWRALYKQQRWLRLRQRYLDRHPICECDDCRTRPPKPARVVHHKDPHRGDLTKFYDWNNLMAMAKPCHDKVTAHEQHR